MLSVGLSYLINLQSEAYMTVDAIIALRIY
jgi:hypothetical protein